MPISKNTTSAFQTQECHELSKFVSQSCKLIMVNGIAIVLKNKIIKLTQSSVLQ